MPNILLAQSGSGLQFIELTCLLKVLPDQLWYGFQLLAGGIQFTSCLWRKQKLNYHRKKLVERSQDNFDISVGENYLLYRQECFSGK